MFYAESLYASFWFVYYLFHDFIFLLLEIWFDLNEILFKAYLLELGVLMRITQ